MSAEDLQNENEQTPEELAKAYDDAWDEANGTAPAGDDTDTDTDHDDGDQDDDQGDTEDDPDTGATPAGEQTGEGDDEEAKAKDEQRRKSWEGRQRAEEQRLKAEKDAIAAEKKALADRKAAIAKALEEGDDETDWDAVAKELEIPELAKLANESKRNRQLLAEQHKVAEDERALSDREAKSTQDETLSAEQEQHFRTITEKHADAFDVVKDDKFKEWMDNLPFKDGVKYQQVMQEGSAAEVVEMLDTFKKAGKPGSRKPDPASLSSVRTGASSRRRIGEPDKNDYDAGWDEATRS